MTTIPQCRRQTERQTTYNGITVHQVLKVKENAVSSVTGRATAHNKMPTVYFWLFNQQQQKKMCWLNKKNN